VDQVVLLDRERLDGCDRLEAGDVEEVPDRAFRRRLVDDAFEVVVAGQVGGDTDDSPGEVEFLGARDDFVEAVIVAVGRDGGQAVGWNARAVARPMPLAPPVTIATFSSV